MKMLPQQYCLRWRYHHSNLQTMFSQLLEREAFCDVTLACEGRTIKAHKIVLSACSTFFDNILSQYEEKDPILIMKDVKYIDIKCLVEFMYRGEINVDHCHLATLLKTAEDLKIKGLAEVSWKDDEENGSHQEVTNSNGTSGIHAALQNVSAVIASPQRTDSCKRKRGRPPIDDYDYSHMSKMANAGTTSDDYSNDDAASPDNNSSLVEDDGNNCDDEHAAEVMSPIPQLKVKPDYKIKQEYQSHYDSGGGPTNDQNEHLLSSCNEVIPAKHYQNATGAPTSTATNNSLLKSSMPSSTCSQQSASTASTSILTAALEKEWPDVVKMNDYLNTGRRQQFWEEPFTKRVMDAIKHKNLEMKIAAELLGVSYGTLYGRYRDAYGCLKHPYRIKDFWTEQGPTDILLKLKRKEITLYRAAEQLNVMPQTLSNYLISMAVLDNETTPSTHTGVAEYEPKYEQIEWDEDNEAITPDALYQKITGVSASMNNSVSPNSPDVLYHKIAEAAASTSNSVLANCPDITIIKKEKYDASRVNNNSDHSNTMH